MLEKENVYTYDSTSLHFSEQVPSHHWLDSSRVCRVQYRLMYDNRLYSIVENFG